MMTLCSRCSQEFICGVNGPASCWCAKKPRLTKVDPQKTCLCEPCLDAALLREFPSSCFRLLVSYNGTDFSGFQIQQNARTVEGELTQALRAIGANDFKLDAAGRTDAGVHARGQVVSLTLKTRLNPRQLQLALSTKLPHDMAVWRVDAMPEGFDARRQSVGKRYVYRIFQGLVADPFHRHQSYFVRTKLDVAAMADAAAAFVGEHNFSSFRASLCTAAHARRYVWHVGVSKSGPIIDIDIRGNAFCMNMVRIMSGTLIDVGRNKRSKAELVAALATSNRSAAGPTAPAHGLTLEEIYYPDALAQAGIPKEACFPRYPVTLASWPFTGDAIVYGGF